MTLTFILTHLPLLTHICVNKLRHHVQVMACRLFGAKSLPESCIENWSPGNKFQWKLNRNSIIFIQENAIENVVRQIGDHFVQVEMG